MKNSAESTYLDELQDEAEKLVSLLKDRHPGLSSWQGFLQERRKDILLLLMDAKETNAMPAEKPPLGLMPRQYHENIRRADIIAAINRFIQAGKPIPPVWIQEYNELTERAGAADDAHSCEDDTSVDGYPYPETNVRGTE